MTFKTKRYKAYLSTLELPDREIDAPAIEEAVQRLPEEYLRAAQKYNAPIGEHMMLPYGAWERVPLDAQSQGLPWCFAFSSPRRSRLVLYYIPGEMTFTVVFKLRPVWTEADGRRGPAHAIRRIPHIRASFLERVRVEPETFVDDIERRLCQALGYEEEEFSLPEPLYQFQVASPYGGRPDWQVGFQSEIPQSDL